MAYVEYGSGPVRVLEPRTYRRAQCQLVGNGPWLELIPPSRGWIPVLVLLGAGFLGAHQTVGAALGVGLLGLGIGGVTWACDWHRCQQKVCPRCMQAVGRDATACHCGFVAQQEH